MTINQLVTEQKKAGEETEFYPTTQEIVDKVAERLSKTQGDTIKSILDIGCGNGAFFEKLDRTDYFYDSDKSKYDSKLVKSYNKYGFEKSNILAEQLPEDVILLGSDFYSNTLIDKKVDVIFCNPPYSDYETWAEKIILEGNARYIVLVIPARWKNCERINYAIEKRHFEVDNLGTFDFLNAERKARATVDVLYIQQEGKVYNGRRYDCNTTDPFDTWFDNTFTFNAEKRNDIFEEEKEKQNKANEIIASGDTAEMLVKFYNEDMEKLYSNYRALERLDPEIFKELKVDVKMLKESLKARLQGLKHLYWDMLFKKYDKLTCRLTTVGKKKVTQKLQDNTAIDFTLENIFQLTMWIIRHSNTLYDEQLTDFFFKLCNSDNIHRYKSDKRWNDDEWKYLKESCTEWGSWRKDKAKKILKNIQLDYRIVVTAYKNFDFDYSTVHLSQDCCEFIYDLSVIAENLGFKIDIQIPDRWDKIDFYEWCNKDIYTTSGELFCNMKLYKNGNRHLKFNPNFMKKLNVEMARINGWVQDKSEVEKELGLKPEEINKLWKSNIQIGITDGSKILGIEYRG